MSDRLGLLAMSGKSLIPKYLLQLLNNLFEIERKLIIQGDPANALRNVGRIKEALEQEGLFYEDPMGQDFAETRTDVEASITGSSTDNLKIVEVIKPIIRAGVPSNSLVIQKGIVVVQTKSEGAI
jgi:hypothetical protein